jgi:hypothetical protein
MAHSLWDIDPFAYSEAVENKGSGEPLNYLRYLAATPIESSACVCSICGEPVFRHSETCARTLFDVCECCCGCWPRWRYAHFLDADGAEAGGDDGEAYDDDADEHMSDEDHYRRLIGENPAVRLARPAAAGIQRVFVVPSFVRQGDSKSGNYELDCHSPVSVHEVPLHYDGGAASIYVCADCGPGSLARVIYLSAVPQRLSSPDAAIAAVASSAPFTQCMHGRAVEFALSASTVSYSVSVYMVGKNALSICEIAPSTWAIGGEHSDKCVSVLTERRSQLLKRRLRCSHCSGNHRRVCSHMLCVGQWLSEHAAVSARDFEDQNFRDYSAVDLDEGDVEEMQDLDRFLPTHCSNLTSTYREMLRQLAIGAKQYPDIFYPASTVR